MISLISLTFFVLFFFIQQKEKKHCALFRASRHGIERLEIFDKEDDPKPIKIITLENCVKITQEPDNNFQINIVKKPNDNHILSASNESELKCWVESLQNVAFKDKASTLTRTNSVREEENDLYCTSYSDGIFTVNLLASDATLLKTIEPKTYTLQLTATEIQLKHLDVNGVTLIAKWPYRYIRKYGYRDGKFTFEAGRKCDTGEGEVKFQHSNPIDVFRCMGAKMKSMKKLIGGDNSSLDCGEHQLNAALSMEAGSRSPLPPSPNQNCYSESSQSQSSHLLHGFLSSTDSLNNLSMSTTTSSIPPMKQTPCKPPRKSIPGSDSNIKPRNDVPPKPSPKSPKYQDYEPVSLAQTGTNDLSKPGSIVLKSSPPPPLPTSPIPSNGNISKNILPLVADHPTMKSPVHSPVVDQPPRIPARYESMIQDDRNYERIENITSAWKTLGVSDVKHTENLSTCEDDFTDFVWQRSQSQKEFGTSRKIPITVNAYCDAEELTSKKKNDDYDKLDFFAAKSPNPASDYRTIVTITAPVYKKQTSQPITSNDYEIIGDCATVTTNNVTLNAEPKTYRLADDSHMGYGILRKPVTNTISPKSSQLQASANTIGVGASTSADDLVNHRKFNGLNYAIVNKSNQV